MKSVKDRNTAFEEGKEMLEEVQVNDSPFSFIADNHMAILKIYDKEHRIVQYEEWEY